MKIFKRFLVITTILLRSETAFIVYYSAHPLIPGTEGDIININDATVFVCSLKCIEHKCFKWGFNEAGK